MSLRRTPDGKLVEDTAPDVEIGVQNRTRPLEAGGGKTVFASDNGDTERPEQRDALDARTRLADWDAGAGSSAPQRAGDTVPTGARPAAAGAPMRTQLEGAAAAAPGLQDGPVVGWLVVEGGPGRGHSLPIRIGMNSVGRGADQRIPLRFGDTMISSNKHFFISFDPRGQGYGIHRGDGANITYLNGQPVYQSEPLSSFDRIEVGGTKLCFVALCGAQFSWADE